MVFPEPGKKFRKQYFCLVVLLGLIFSSCAVEPTAAPTISPTRSATAEQSPTKVPSATPTPTQAPTRVPAATATREFTPIPRATPLAATGQVVGVCSLNAEQRVYVSYNLSRRIYRNLSEPVKSPSQNYQDLLHTLEGETIGLKPDDISIFQLPLEWKNDRNYRLLAASRDGFAALFHRFGEYRSGIYWGSRENQIPVKIISVAGTVEEIHLSGVHDLALFRVADVDKHNLYLVNLVNGSAANLTVDVQKNAYGGKISPDGKRVAWWTADGIWVADISGGSLRLTIRDGIEPDWSPDSRQLTYAVDGQIQLGVWDGSESRSLTVPGKGLAVAGFNPQFSPDGSRIIFWSTQEDGYRWEMIDLGSQVLRTLLTAGGAVRRNYGDAFRWSPDGNWFIGAINYRQAGGSLAGDHVCSLQQESCWPLDITPTDNFRCRDSIWSNRQAAITWEFNTVDDSQGWKGYQQVRIPSVKNGSLWTMTMGTAPRIVSPFGLAIDAVSYPTIQIRMRVAAGTSARLYFLTSRDQNYDEKKSILFSLTAGSLMQTYTLETGRIAEWDGSIVGFGLEPTQISGVEVEVDYIRVMARP